jgi:hypothetical protein
MKLDYTMSKNMEKRIYDQREMPIIRGSSTAISELRYIIRSLGAEVFHFLGSKYAIDKMLITDPNSKNMLSGDLVLFHTTLYQLFRQTMWRVD